MNVGSSTEKCARRRQTVVRVVIVLDGETELLEVVGALHTTSRFTRRLDGGEKETDQNTDDRDNDQQFDERKPIFSCGHGKTHFYRIATALGERKIKNCKSIEEQIERPACQSNFNRND